MSVLIGGVLLGAGVLLFVLEPVFSGKSAPMYDGDDVFDEGAARRRVALTALRDLEYDRATGKLDENDYGQLRTELSREALEHLGDQGEGGGRGPDRASRELEEEIAELRRAIREGMQCSGCEYLNRLGARFCARCGEGLGGGE
ncbi:MAG: c-type cytochrome biogenesis protein CcmI [Gemmatimonadota bacterium]|nr:c-type cytochrome biogenesis protein CcmI [Gemmatimonadota bacterium]MDE2983162.1 c-type cytochrome biogenesis protein CcmI [Gemmatimonadota bacterium]